MRRFTLLLLAVGCSGSAAVPSSPKPPAPVKTPVDSRTIVLDTPADTPFGIAVDDVNVYYTLIDTGIRRTPKRGGPIDVVTDDDHGPHRIVIDDLWVYAADLGTPDADFQDGRIVRATKFGSPIQILDRNLGAPDDLVLHGDDVLYSCAGTRSFGAYNNDGAIFRVPRDGSAPPTRLAKNQRHPVAIAADAIFVYWLNDYQGSVMRCAITGCNETPDVLYDNQNVPRSIVVDDAWIYWSNQQDTNVVRAPKGGGGMIVELAGSRGFPESIVLDHGELYWTEVLTHTIQTQPKDGSVRPFAVAEDLGLPVQVVVDADSVYFTDQGKSNVVRVPR